MDDIVVLTKNKQRLRRVVKQIYQLLEDLKLQISQAKTWIGRLSKGFSFLGYQIKPQTLLCVRQETVDKSIARVTRLSERQLLSKERLERHMQGFVRWAKGGLAGLIYSQIVEDKVRAALNQAGFSSTALKHKSVLHKTSYNRGKLWFGYWLLRR